MNQSDLRQPTDPDKGAELMERVREGDSRAFAELVMRYQRTILNLTFRYLGDRATAEEVSQEVFVRIYNARMNYEPSARFETWLYRIVMNLCANTAEKMRRRRTISIDRDRDDGESSVVIPSSERSAIEQLEQDEVVDRVQAAIAALPDQQRAAILMSRYQEMPLREIGDVLGVSVEAVKSLLFRARESLRQRLTPYLREGAHDGR